MPGRKLIVEGNSDVGFIKELCSQHGIELNVRDEISQHEGIDGALEQFRIAILMRSYDAVGLVIDADTDAKAAWAKAKGRISAAGIKEKIPAVPPQEGLVLAEKATLSRIGVWIMPDNVAAGNIERLASFMIPQGDNLRPHAQQIVSELPKPVRFPKARTSKAEIHSWLAWQKEPGQTIGGAIRSKYLDANCVEAQRFIAWVQRLFRSEE